MTTISTNTLYGLMARTIQRARSDVATAQTEATTGQHADMGLALGLASGGELSIRNETSILNAMMTANGLIGARLTATQTALDSVRTGAQNMLQTLVGGSQRESDMGSLAVSALGDLTNALNTETAGEYVLGGINASVPPIADFSAAGSGSKSAIDASFVAAFGMSPTSATTSTITGAEMKDYLDGPFAAEFNDQNWAANWSTASNVNRSAEIAPGSNIEVSTNANTPGVRMLAQAYTMLATLGGATLGSDARQAVMTKASTLIQSGIAALTSTQASMGSAQSRVNDATTGINATLSLLRSRQASLDGVDQYTAATTVNELTTQIQTAYQLTAQLQKLSLAQYLPT